MAEMAVLNANGRRFELRRAAEADVPELVALLSDDPMGATREADTLAPYLRAFAEIDGDDNQLLLAVRNLSGGLVATMHLTSIPGLARGGPKRRSRPCESSLRGPRKRTWLGSVRMDTFLRRGSWSNARATDIRQDPIRPDAHRFCAQLGYEATHKGFKREP